MHFEYAPTGRPPAIAYELTLRTDTGLLAAELRIADNGVTIHPGPGFSIDSWTNGEQSESRIQLKEHKP